jgi:S-DNA-T family DNA segregation ATPase FtsK/SpoIIIE
MSSDLHEHNGHAEQVDLDATRHFTTDADDDDGERVLVDSAEAQRPPRPDPRTATRRPILPPWLRSLQALRKTVAWAITYAAYIAAFQAVRVPTLYLGRLALRSPRGAWRIAAATFTWMLDLEGHPVRRAARDQADAGQYLRLQRHRDARVKVRGTATAIVVVPLVGIVAVLAVAAGPIGRAVLAVAGVVVLGAFGKRPDKPLLDTAVVKAKASRLTSEMVRRAFVSLGISGMSERNTGAITFPAPITRDGPGWRADIDLPHGVTASDVIERRDKLASALRRPLGSVWPEPAHEQHAGRLVLWVGDEDMSQAKQPAWPLIRAGTVNLFRAFPFGTDPRGRIVPLTLMYASMVIGSVPRMGKTFSLRLALLAAALDPTVELHVYDLKGTGDLGPLEFVSHRYRAGDEDRDVSFALGCMREVRDDMRRRTKEIRGLPRHLAPESKITRELVKLPQYRLHPIVIGVDECQAWFEHPEFGDELASVCEDIIRRGPAVGIMLILATQRPDAKSLPKGISANAVLRFCFKVMSHVENDMVLGGSAHRNGIRATMFTRRDLGIGYLAGEGDDPVIARTFYVDAPAAERIAARARYAREKAGTLSGHAIGEEPESGGTLAKVEELLADVLVVVPPNEDRLWGEILLERLAAYRPQVYGTWSREHLTAALKDLDIDATGQVWATDPATGQGANRRGIWRADVVAVATERDRRRRAS